MGGPGRVELLFLLLITITIAVIVILTITTTLTLNLTLTLTTTITIRVEDLVSLGFRIRAHDSKVLFELWAPGPAGFF